MENMQHHEKTKLLNYRHRSGGRILGYWHKPHLQQDDKNKKNKTKKKHIPIQIQEEYRTPNRKDQKRNFP